MPDAKLPALDKIDPAEAWRPWEPDSRQPWDLKWAGHLYRRAAFGAGLVDLREAVRQGFDTTFDRLLLGDPKTNDDRQKFFSTIGATFAKRNNSLEMRGWWLYCMYYTPHPLREKLALFWHNHFATSIVKVQSIALMFKQNELIRKHALGKFGPFLLAMSQDPAMILWLDNNSNLKGKPNENYAREIMELFSLGVGNYTEQDIKEAARAFTGWQTDNERFTFNAEQHDDGTKTVLGQTGNWNGDDVVRIVLEQPVAARFLVRKLYRYFISETQPPPDALIEPLAEQYRKSGFDTLALVRTMLRSRHFFSAHAYRQRVKSPVEFVLGAVHAIGQGFVSPNALVPKLEEMGQVLFAPPNVKGWEHGRSWLNTATVVVRSNFAEALAQGKGDLNLGDPTATIAVAVDPAAIFRREKITQPKEIVQRAAEILLQGDLDDKARQRLVAYLEEGKPDGDALDQRIREVIHAIMTMPEYQLA